jgi:hypothetical protein
MKSATAVKSPSAVRSSSTSVAGAMRGRSRCQSNAGHCDGEQGDCHFVQHDFSLLTDFLRSSLSGALFKGITLMEINREINSR